MEEKTKDALGRGDSVREKRPSVQRSRGELGRRQPQPERRVGLGWEAGAIASGGNTRIIFPEGGSGPRRDFQPKVAQGRGGIFSREVDALLF